MTPAEAAALLTICAAYDNRKPDADTARAWAIVLDGHRFEDCRDAVVQHYRTSRDWIMPADVIAAVKKTRTGRLEDVAPSPPPGLDPDDTGTYARWLADTRRLIANGEPAPDYGYQPTRQIGELRHVLRAVPAIEAKPKTKTAEHHEALEKARAELATVAIVHPDATQPDPAAPAHDGGSAVGL